MKRKDLKDKCDDIKADLYSRPNSVNGKYEACQLFYLVDLQEVKGTDLFYLKSLQVRADSADKIIEEAELEGINTDDPETLKLLGEKINNLGTLVHKRESTSAAIYISSRVTISFGLAIAMWSIVFSQSFFTFFFYGLAIGLIFCLLVIIPIIVKQRIKERVKDLIFSISAIIIANLCLGIGIIGLLVGGIKLIFF